LLQIPVGHLLLAASLADCQRWSTTSWSVIYILPSCVWPPTACFVCQGPRLQLQGNLQDLPVPLPDEGAGVRPRCLQRLCTHRGGHGGGRAYLPQHGYSPPVAEASHYGPLQCSRYESGRRPWSKEPQRVLERRAFCSRVIRGERAGKERVRGFASPVCVC